MEHAEDAGVYRLRDDLAIIQTVDFFTPIVDDPYIFGQIAVTNALGDVYAMGGKPLTAMNIVCFPIRKMAIGILREILRGGLDKMREAGVLLIGGHSVEDDELKYGLSVTGTIHPDKVLFNRGAQAGGPADPDQGARHGDRQHGPQGRSRRCGARCPLRHRNDHAQQTGGRTDGGGGSGPCLHGCHRLRLSRPCPGDDRGERYRHADSVLIRALLPGGPVLCRGGDRPRRADPQPEIPGSAGRNRTRSAPTGSSTSSSIRRPPGGSSSPCRQARRRNSSAGCTRPGSPRRRSSARSPRTPRERSILV